MVLERAARLSDTLKRHRTVDVVKHRARLITVVAMAVYGAIQLAHTVTNARHWPFCPYNMFNFVARGPAFSRWVITLIDRKGQTLEVSPGNIFPLEFFRANAMVNRFLADEAVSNASKDQMLHSTLRRLNEHPWRGFDETWPSASPSDDAPFVAVRVIYRTENVTAASGRILRSLVNDELVYAYGPE